MSEGVAECGWCAGVAEQAQWLAGEAWAAGGAYEPSRGPPRRRRSEARLPPVTLGPRRRPHAPAALHRRQRSPRSALVFQKSRCLLRLGDYAHQALWDTGAAHTRKRYVAALNSRPPPMKAQCAGGARRGTARQRDELGTSAWPPGRSTPGRAAPASCVSPCRLRRSAQQHEPNAAGEAWAASPRFRAGGNVRRGPWRADDGSAGGSVCTRRGRSSPPQRHSLRRQMLSSPSGKLCCLCSAEGMQPRLKKLHWNDSADFNLEYEPYELYEPETEYELELERDPDPSSDDFEVPSIIRSPRPMQCQGVCFVPAPIPAIEYVDCDFLPAYAEHVCLGPAVLDFPLPCSECQYECFLGQYRPLSVRHHCDYCPVCHPPRKPRTQSCTSRCPRPASIIKQRAHSPKRDLPCRPATCQENRGTDPAPIMIDQETSTPRIEEPKSPEKPQTPEHPYAPSQPCQCHPYQPSNQPQPPAQPHDSSSHINSAAPSDKEVDSCKVKKCPSSKSTSSQDRSLFKTLFPCCAPNDGESCDECICRKIRDIPFRVQRVCPRGCSRFLDH